MKVGIPMMKCSLHPSQQVNSKTGKASKTCGLKSAWQEMNDERQGRDQTIDRSMTDRNVWMEGNTNDDVVAMVQEEIDRINDDRHEHGKRALREDCVSVVEIVEKPGIDYMKNLSYEEKVDFLKNSHEVMSDIIHEWNPDWKMIESVQHHDEFGGLSAHNHSLVLLTSHDPDGTLTMRAKSELNLKFFTYVNENYPRMMRERGYEVEDCRTYDRLSDEEKEQRRLHPEEHGVDAYTYKTKKAAELSEKVEQLETRHTDLSEKIGNAEEKLQDLNVKAEESSQQLETVSSQLAEAEEKTAELEHREEKVSAAEERITRLTESPDIQKYDEVRAENQQLKEELSFKDKVINELQERIKSLEQSVQHWKEEFTRAAKNMGSRIMEKLGFDTHETTQQYPSRDMTEAFRETTEGAKKIDPAEYRVIPDREHEGKYCIAVKEKDGYRTIEDGFSSREEADEQRREMQQVSQGLNDDLSESEESRRALR